LHSLNEEFRKAGVQLGENKKDWKDKDAEESERYLGVKIPIMKFKNLQQDGEAHLNVGLAYSLWIEKEDEVNPYVIISLDYPSSKQWKSYFQEAEKRLDKEGYKLKAYANASWLHPKAYDKYRRQNLEDIDHDLEEMVKKFLNAL
jgi:hypothetical protein